MKMIPVNAVAMAVAAVVSATAAAQTAQQSVAEPDAPTAKGASDSAFLQEVIVTATRREENAQRVGISITAFGEEQLQMLSLESQGDVANYTPAVEFVRFWAGKGANSVFFIRGLGQADFNEATEAPAGLYADEFYILTSGASDFLLYDTARVETLRGPQGSLFGRNTTAGAVSITNNRPTRQLEGRLVTTVGSFSKRELDGFINVPVTDKLALRLSGNTDDAEGYTRNFFDVDRAPSRVHDSDFSSYRAQLLFEPTNSISMLYKYQLGRVNSLAGLGDISNPAQAVAGDVINAPTDVFGYSRELDGLRGPYEVDIDTRGHIYNKVHIHFGRIDVDLSDAVQLSSLSGYFGQQRENTEDCDGSPRTLCNAHNQTAQHYFTQELKLAGTTERTKWTTGLYYLDQHLANIFEVLLFSGTNVASAIGLPSPANGLIQLAQTEQDLESYAAYANVAYQLNDKFTLTTGVRATRDEKEIDETEGLLIHDFPDSGLKTAVGSTFGYVNPSFHVEGRDMWDELRENHIVGAVDPLTRFSRETAGELARYRETYYTGEIQLDYTPSDDLLLYLGFRRGIKGGGFNNGLFDITTDTFELIPVKKEVNHDLEGGYKWRFGRGVLNQSFFYYDYEGYQATAFVGSGTSLSTVITNNDATVMGSEVEFTFSPIDGLDIRLAGAFLDTKVKDVSNRGVVKDRELGRAPKLQASGIVRYELDAFGGTLAPQINFHWTDERYVDVVNNTQGLLQAYGQVNLSTSWYSPNDVWFIAASLLNANDASGPANIFEVTGAGNVGQVNYLPPRRWQVEFGVHF